MRKINIAQLGAGHWGPNLVRNFMQLEDVGEFTICDTNPARLERMKALHPTIRLSRSPAEVLEDSNVDAVVVALPASLHHEYTKKALLADKHVLVEKPLAMTAGEARELVRLSDETGKILMVGHTYLYNTAVRKIKEYLDGGEIGELYYILSQRLNLGRVRRDVNVLWNLAPHDISIILYWLGEFPGRVSAKGLTFLQDGIEDVVFMDMDFPSGRAAHVHVSWLHPDKTRKMYLVGGRRMIIYDDVSTEAKITICDKGVDKKNIIRELPDIETYGQFQLIHRAGDIHIPRIDVKEPLSVECAHFVECIRNGSVPFTDGRNGLDVVSVLEMGQKELSARK